MLIANVSSGDLRSIHVCGTIIVQDICILCENIKVLFSLNDLQFGIRRFYL